MAVRLRRGYLRQSALLLAISVLGCAVVLLVFEYRSGVLTSDLGSYVKHFDRFSGELLHQIRSPAD